MLEKQYKEFFKTLANEQRVEIVLCLMKAPMTVGELADCLEAPQSTISHNLKRLLKCSFVTVKARGKERVYSVNKKTIAPLFKLIERHAETYCKPLCCT